MLFKKRLWTKTTANKGLAKNWLTKLNINSCFTI